MGTHVRGACSVVDHSEPRNTAVQLYSQQNPCRDPGIKLCPPGGRGGAVVV
jgi:hypothetical protein